MNVLCVVPIYRRTISAATMCRGTLAIHNTSVSIRLQMCSRVLGLLEDILTYL